MYGGSSKLSGGRGRGNAVGPIKRNIHSTFQPSSVQRPSSAAGGGGRGGHRNRSNTPATAPTVTVSSTADESFSLVRSNPLNFGMIIKLSPVLVDEIKRLESQGGSARIKFDSSAKNLSGNVIDVGGKVFRFTWSQETGDLCDIYEERRGGENGDGLLVESGGAWRKVNVQRELDDSVQNHVKMRTVEAERKHKSRKAIVLDHGNPSMKKALAAAEVNNSRKGSSYKQKKEPPFKKMKAESSSVIPPKSGGKGGLFSSTPSKVKASPSPLPLLSTPDQFGAPLSPLRNSKNSKLHANREDTILTQSSKDPGSTSEKEMLSRFPAGGVQNKPGSNERLGNKPTDLQGLLISLLMEKPQGMNIKALEKAIGETVPKSVKQIEPVLKKIAVFQTPGRYVLKPDVDLESFKKTFSEIGSSPENSNYYREAPAAEPNVSLKPNDVKEFEEPSHLISEPHEEFNTLEKVDIDQISPGVLKEKIPDNNEGPAASSSGSDSDSESDSSDSGSDSRSPAGSGSGSSSDSESDASANSKEGSDEDVDIMSDDDKQPNEKLLQSSMVDEKDDGHGSDLAELEKDLFGDNQEADMHLTNSYPDRGMNSYADETANLFNNHLDYQQSEAHDHSRKVASENLFKRGSVETHFDMNEDAKRLKSDNWPQPAFSRSPDGTSDGLFKGIANQLKDRNVRDISDYDNNKVENREFHRNYVSDSPRSGPISIDLNAHANAPADFDNMFGYSERDLQGYDDFNMQRDSKANKDTRDEDGHYKGRRPPKSSGGKHSGSRQKKHNSSVGKFKESGLVSISQNKDLPIDLKKSPVINGRGPTLRRELSDLEMGELRENLHEEASGVKKRFEKNNSFKQSEKLSSSDYWNMDESKGKFVGRASLDPPKASPFQSGIGMSGIQQSLPKKAAPENHVDDYTRLNGKPISKVDHPKVGSQQSRGRHHDAGAKQGIGSEGYTDSQRKVSVGPPHNHEKQVASLMTKDKKRHKSKDLKEKRKDFWPIDKRKEMESCSNDSIASYIKYEKEEPELKGPIRDLPQYNEYVQEYREKYDIYHALNKVLESYRNEFQTFGRDLELAKGTDDDRYNKVLEQLMESYRQCGMKHKRLKKIFVILHHELQHLKEMIRDFADKQTKG
uniref:uncharacterized protein LOC122589312 isoform X2 n=1 Tax=Erigeron canadensis TaxID=72917 RepID=UPI001CB8EB8E|nr:uncharacterized protein LOC122589312 isoform X2 [Erigeron canadensis]